MLRRSKGADSGNYHRELSQDISIRVVSEIAPVENCARGSHSCEKVDCVHGNSEDKLHVHVENHIASSHPSRERSNESETSNCDHRKLAMRSSSPNDFLLRSMKCSHEVSVNSTRCLCAQAKFESSVSKLKEHLL